MKPITMKELEAFRSDGYRERTLDDEWARQLFKDIAAT